MEIKKIHNIAVGFLQTNCWIIPLDDEKNTSACAVIDPGDEADRIIAMLDQLKLYPMYIILTHGHFDHIGAVPDLIEECEKRYSVKPLLAAHPEEILKNLKPDIYLKEGDTIGCFTVLHLPGHSPGSIGLLDKQAGMLFSGDTLFCGGYGRTDLPGGNEAQLFASLKRLFAMDGNIKVYPGHDETTTIGIEALG